MPVPDLDLGPLLTVASGPADMLGPSTLPLALFPVRLETRLFGVDGGGVELRVRVYPDKIHLDAHDPALTADEVAAGEAYWQARWAATADSAARLAWSELAGRLGPRRAAWVQRRLTPTNLAARPGGGPHFPDLGPPATTPRNPRAVLLPDRWVATAFLDGAVAAVATGRDLPRTLAISPDLAAPVTIDHENPAIDPAMRWMIDFETAEGVGMALRLPLPRPEVDLLLVAGVSAGDRSADVAAALDAHHYTDGLAFLAPGTPTNNTAAGRTPFRSNDPAFEKSYAVEVGPDAAVPGSYADLAGRALGLDAFHHVANAGNVDDGVAKAMATVLWPATWGYFLSQMVGFEGTGLTLGGLDRGRRHAVDYVRPGGPLPALQAGAQPYGLLPVTSVDSWTTAAPDPAAPDPAAPDPAAARLPGLLAALREVVWRPAGNRVPRVGATDDPSSDLADVLRTPARSTSFAVRGLMGQQFLEHLRAFLTPRPPVFGPPPPDYWVRLGQLTNAVSAAVGLGSGLGLSRAVHEDVAHPVRTPLVGDPTYLTELLAVTDVDALATPVPAGADPLLKVLVRHSLLRLHAEQAARLLDQPATPAAQLLHDEEFVDLVPGQPPTTTWRRLRDALVPGTTTSVRDQLAQSPGPEVAEFRAALQLLAMTDKSVVEQHLVATLDATSHRLDAWVTSLATRRLGDLRLHQPTGLAVGGYGWVQNLRTGAGRTPVDPMPGEPGPLAALPDDAGFIHAPSMNQASAAALLRNAHLAHGGTPQSPFAVELTSGRIRLVRHLFDGVRQGQPLGALLGYLLERRLHEAGLDDLIEPLRGLAPLPGAAAAGGAGRMVVDGLALSAQWQSTPDAVLASMGPNDTRRSAATNVLNGLGAAVDAAADAVQAEAAFQLVRGNFTRAATSLEAIATGAAPPPDLGFLKTPRTGVGVTHRVAMMLPVATAGPGPGWSDATPRALADPALNAWAGRLLGPAEGVTVRVTDLDPAGGPAATWTVALSVLNLAPIDLVWATPGQDGVPADLVQRLVDARPAVAGTPAPAGVRVELARSGNERGLADLIEIAQRVRRLLAGSRPLDGADLQPPHVDPVRGLDLDEFAARADTAERALAVARTALAQALDAGTDLRAPLLTVARFGVGGALAPTGPVVPAQARAVLAEVDRRLRPATPVPPTADEATRRDGVLARFRAVFGDGFLALPRFTAVTAPDLAASVADVGALVGEDRLAAYTWLLRMERVRPGLTRLGQVLREAEALGSTERLTLAVAQVPHVSGQRWLGRPLADTGAPAEGCASLVIQGLPADPHGLLCGLLADEWTEIIPSRTETTGLAFRYAPPDSVAPQAILLAVPPVLGQAWTIGSLNRVLLETLDLGRLRAVSADSLGDIAHFLPAAYLAFNADADAVSTDLAPLTT